MIENSVKWKSSTVPECTKFVLLKRLHKVAAASLLEFPRQIVARREVAARTRCNLGILLSAFLLLMRILFAISILCFLALIWAAVAITRRVRATHKLNSSTKPEFSQYLFDAAEDGKSSPLHSTAAHGSPQDLSTSKNRPANQGHANSYDKITSTERG